MRIYAAVRQRRAEDAGDPELSLRARRCSPCASVLRERRAGPPELSGRPVRRRTTASTAPGASRSATRSPTACWWRAPSITWTCCATWRAPTARASPGGSGTRPWSTSKGAFNAISSSMEMTNGVRAGYEGSGTAAGEQNPWHATSTTAPSASAGRSRSCPTGPGPPAASATGGRPDPPLHARPGPRRPRTCPCSWSAPHRSRLADRRVPGLARRRADPATVLEENVQSVAMVFAAIEASRTSRVVDVQAMVRELRQG